MSDNKKLNSIKKLSDDALEDVTGGTSAITTTELRGTAPGIHTANMTNATQGGISLLMGNKVNNGNNIGKLNKANNTDNGNNTASIKSTSVTSVGANSIQYG